jgi:hypothetical protein
MATDISGALSEDAGEDQCHHSHKRKEDEYVGVHGEGWLPFVS